MVGPGTAAYARAAFDNFKIEPKAKADGKQSAQGAEVLT
jgi:hypothetical protein